MKKKIIILMVSVLLIGVNVFAQGNLIVNGSMGIGTSTPSTSLEIDTGSNGEIAIQSNGSVRVDAISGTVEDIIAFDANVNVGSAANSKGVVGAKYLVRDPSDEDKGITGGYFWMLMQGVEGSDSTMTKTKNQYGQLNLLETRSAVTGSAGTYTYSGDVVGGRGLFARGSNNRNFDYQKIRGFDVIFTDFGGGTGVVTYLDVKGLNVQQFPSSSYFKTTDFAGVWIDSQPNVTGTASGIVLDGEGAGSDVVFGEHTNSVRPRIYSVGGQIYADDALGSHSLISPHDPVTGEWIFYSKNLRTGKVVKVNMEKLVKAVEKITGEKFLFETIEEIE